MAHWDRPSRGWGEKFRAAFRGMVVGVRGQSSFFVHFSAAGLVLAAAVALRTNWLEGCVLLLCITAVMAAEMFNSALEQMALAVSDQHDPNLADALDIGSAAVLTTAIGASLIGVIIFGYRLVLLFG